MLRWYFVRVERIPLQVLVLMGTNLSTVEVAIHNLKQVGNAIDGPIDGPIEGSAREVGWCSGICSASGSAT